MEEQKFRCNDIVKYNGVIYRVHNVVASRSKAGPPENMYALVRDDLLDEDGEGSYLHYAYEHELELIMRGEAARELWEEFDVMLASKYDITINDLASTVV